MMESSHNYLDEAKKLAEYIVKLSPDKIPKEYTNLQRKTTFGKPMIEDFGDFFPFIFWAGKQKWAWQVSKDVLKEYQTEDGLFKTGTIYDADKMSDIVVGLQLMGELTKDPSYVYATKRVFDGLKKKMITRKGYVIYKKTPLFNYPLSSGKFAGIYIEEAAKLHETEGEYLKLSQHMASPWIQNKFSEKYGLFPFACTSFLKPLLNTLFKRETSFDFDTFMLAKSNTNLIFGLTRLYKNNKNATLKKVLCKWYRSLPILENKTINTLWAPKKNLRLCCLETNIAAIDALIDITLATGEQESLKLAESVSQAWIGYQNKTGLIDEVPQVINTGKLSKKMVNFSMKNKHISRLDSQTDFSVVLLKLWDLTENQTYLTSAKKIIDGIIKYHKFEDGYVEFVNTKTGSHENSKVIETKFLSLLIKAFMTMHECNNDRKIYKNKLLIELVRDR